MEEPSCVDGQAQPRLSSWFFGSVKRGLWPDEMPFSSRALPSARCGYTRPSQPPFKNNQRHYWSLGKKSPASSNSKILPRYVLLMAREKLAGKTLQSKRDAVQSPSTLTASEPVSSNTEVWILEEGLAYSSQPNKHSLVRYIYTPQYPKRVLI